MPEARRITSRQHPFVQRCRSVARRRTGAAILLDGEHLVRAALDAGLSFEAVLSGDAPPDLLAGVTARGIPLYRGTAAVLEAASPVRTPTGIVAVAEWTPRPPEAILTASPALVVGLVDVQDPGNVGAVIRTADALGASGVIALDATSDPAGWKALRGAMGSTFRLPVGRGTLEAALAAARRRGVTVAAGVARGGRAVDDSPVAPPLLLLVGNEGAGLPTAVAEAADVRLEVPMRHGVESLNVAVSAAIVLWEARRRKRPGGRTT